MEMRAVAAVVNGESSLWSVLWVTQQLPLLISEWHDTIPDSSQKAFQIVLCFHFKDKKGNLQEKKNNISVFISVLLKIDDVF